MVKNVIPQRVATQYRLHNQTSVSAGPLWAVSLHYNLSNTLSVSGGPLLMSKVVGGWSQSCIHISQRLKMPRVLPPLPYMQYCMVLHTYIYFTQE